MTELVQSADILITTEQDAHRVLGIARDSYEDIVRSLVEEFGLKVVAITLRENLSVWRNRWTAIAYEAATDEVHRAQVFDIEVVDHAGSGDAFAGGFLYGYFRQDVVAGVRYGVDISAIRQTPPATCVHDVRRSRAGSRRGRGLRIVR